MSKTLDPAFDRFVARFRELMADDIHELIGALVSEYGNPVLPDGSILPETFDALLTLGGRLVAEALHAALMPPVDPSQPVN